MHCTFQSSVEGTGDFHTRPLAELGPSTRHPRSSVMWLLHENVRNALALFYLILEIVKWCTYHAISSKWDRGQHCVMHHDCYVREVLWRDNVSVVCVPIWFV